MHAAHMQPGMAHMQDALVTGARCKRMRHNAKSEADGSKTGTGWCGACLVMLCCNPALIPPVVLAVRQERNMYDQDAAC